MSHLKNLLFVYSKDIMVLWCYGEREGTKDFFVRANLFEFGRIRWWIEVDVILIRWNPPNQNQKFLLDLELKINKREGESEFTRFPSLRV